MLLLLPIEQLTHSWGGGNSLTQTLIEKKNVTSVIIIVMRDLRVFLIRQVERGFLSKFLKDFDDFSKSGVGYWWRRTVKLWKKIIPCSHLLLKIAKKTINFFHCLPKKKHLNKWLDGPIFSKQTVLHQKRMWNLSPNFNLLFRNFSK